MWKKIVKALTDLKVLVGTPTHHCARFAAENVPLEPQANGQGVKGAGRPTSPVLPAYSADLTRCACRSLSVRSVLLPCFCRCFSRAEPLFKA
jgi:hypothetical protein